MADQRQGVTPAQHDVLDFLDKYRGEWAGLYPTAADQSFAAQTTAARAAARGVPETHKRKLTIEAAARLIDVAERLTKGQTR